MWKITRFFFFFTESPTATSTSRFINFDENDFEEFLASKENERTKKKTVNHIKLLQEYIQATKGDVTPIENLDPKVLNKYLCSFFLGVRKKNLDEYEPNYLKNI